MLTHAKEQITIHLNELNVSQLCADGGIAFHHAIWLKRMEIGQVSEVQERFTIGDPLEYRTHQCYCGS